MESLLCFYQLFWPNLASITIMVLWLLVTPWTWSTGTGCKLVRLAVRFNIDIEKGKKVKRLKLKSRSNPPPSKLQSPQMGPTVGFLDPTASLQQISATLVLPSSECSNQSPSDFEKLQLLNPPLSLYVLPAMSLFILICHGLFSCKLFNSCEVLYKVLSHLYGFWELESTYFSLSLKSVGQPDPNYVSMVKGKKGKISSSGSSVVAVLDNIPVEFSGNKYSTIQTAKCEIFIQD